MAEAEGVDGVVAVIDGHGGARAAEFLQKNLTPTLVHQVSTPSHPEPTRDAAVLAWAMRSLLAGSAILQS